MSKMSKKKARRRRQHRARSHGLVLMCSSCMATEELTPPVLMDRLAGALNALEAAGMPPRVRHGFILAEGQRGGGFILPPLQDDPWTVKMVTYHPSSPLMSRREDDLDS